jgi:hypothetical protein
MIAKRGPELNFESELKEGIQWNPGHNLGRSG